MMSRNGLICLFRHRFTAGPSPDHSARLGFTCHILNDCRPYTMQTYRHFHRLTYPWHFHPSSHCLPDTPRHRTAGFHSSIYKSKHLMNAVGDARITSPYTSLFHGRNDLVRLSRFCGFKTQQSRCDSKIEQTLKVIKETAAGDVKQSSPPDKKPSIWQRVVTEVKHYYHGFRLLFIDFRVAVRILWSLRDGRTLARRERRQLVRATADLFRLVPFLVFIIVPFMEFLLPFALKFFPDMLPSTFESENRKQEKLKKTLKGKLEMAKFLQKTIEESALQRKEGAKDTHIVEDFSAFLTKIRTSGELASVDEIKKYCKLFENEITLDNLSRAQLRALCRVLELPSIGPDYILRFQLRMQLRILMADDKMILKEGIDSMTTWELQSACKARGMRALGQSEERLRSQLAQWIDLHIDQEVPTSLLLLTRAMYISEHLPTTDQLQATMSALPEAMASEAKLKVAELSGEKVDNLAKLQRIKEEEQAIRLEKEEMLSAKQQAEMLERKIQAEELVSLDDKLEMIETAIDLDAKEKAKEESEKITQQELEDIECAIEELADQKELNIDMEELDDLKEDFSEYSEDVEELKEVIVASGGSEQDLRESKAATRLKKQMSRLIGEMDGFIDQLHKEKSSMQEEIEVKEVRIKHSSEPTTRDKMMDEVDIHKSNIVSINDLLLSLRRIQKVPDDARVQTILEVLDEDKDGSIEIDTILKVIETLAKENVKLSKEQVTDVISLIKRESQLELEEKKEKGEKENVKGGEVEKVEQKQ